MDRPEPGLVKWSPNPGHDSFLHINLQHRVVQLYEPNGRAQRGVFDHANLSRHDDFPPLTTYDWSPSIPGLVAVGTSTGLVNLLRIDDNSNAYLELGVKVARTCQAVAFNTTGKLAVGFDRVRSDNCLYVWDVNRLSTAGSPVTGFPADIEPFHEPADRLEPSVSVSSVKFFEDNPNILVAAVKGQGLRIHDLREHGHSAVIQFQTKCCNNLAIDYADQNYFASSALDQPGIMVWDRRATQRQHASPAYLEAVDQDDVPWGGALRLDRVMHMETDPTDSKNSVIRSLRFCRDRAGMLAVLSRTGQLKILSTKHEYAEPDRRLAGSPELLEVGRSFEVDPLCAEPGRKNDRIVSFDWVTLNSHVLKPRLLVLRNNGAFEILEKPSFTAEYPFKLIPWQLPHRGLDGGGKYHAPIEIEPSQAPGILSPLITETLLSDVRLFGPKKADLDSLLEKSLSVEALKALMPEDLAEEEPMSEETRISHTIGQASSIADKLKALRIMGESRWEKLYGNFGKEKAHSGVQSDGEPMTQRERRDALLAKTKKLAALSRKAEETVDHTMLLRAKEKYLFDFARNQQVVADDPWLRDAWAWVAGAEEAAADGNMTAYPLDLSYMGIHTIWTNNLGSKPLARLLDGAVLSDVGGEERWERCLNTINKKLHLPKWNGVETRRPHHRELCLNICNWGRATDAEFEEDAISVSRLKKDSTWHTRAAAHALFRDDIKEAVQVLKQASTEHPELLFVSLALQLVGNGEDDESTRKALDFDERVASKTDPYLRAISSIIATGGDWHTIANQRSLPLRDRALVALRHLPDDALTAWLERWLGRAVEMGNVDGIVLTGITDALVDILACHVQRFGDVQTAALLLAVGAPRAIDDLRANAFRAAYRAYLQRHRAFYLRARFDVESTKRSKLHGRPTVRPPARQITLRCVYCDAETSLSQHGGGGGGGGGSSTGGRPSSGGTMVAASGSTIGRGAEPQPNPFTQKMVDAGISCPNCKRQLPRCVVCLEVVGMPRSDEGAAAAAGGGGGRGDSEPTSSQAALTSARRFPTFCLRCEHVLHLDHARQWFARHQECPVPECRCKCNFRANPELGYH